MALASSCLLASSRSTFSAASRLVSSLTSCAAMYCQTTIKGGLDQVAQHVSACLACGSLLPICHASKEADNVLNDVDVGHEVAWCIQSIAHYNAVAASTAKCKEPCLHQATPSVPAWVGVYLSSMAGCHRLGMCQGATLWEHM